MSEYLTDRGNDVCYDILAPISLDDARKHCGRGSGGAPWGAPAAGSLAREVLLRTGALLDVLEEALRDGALSEAGVCGLESFQRFYTSLKRQLDGAPR